MTYDEVILMLNAVFYACILISACFSFLLKKAEFQESITTTEKIIFAIVGFLFVICVLGAAL